MPDIHNARQIRRTNENTWRKTGLEIHRQIFTQHRREVNYMILRAKQLYHQRKLLNQDQKACFRVIARLLNTSLESLPDKTNTKDNDFAHFFTNKITLIREQIQQQYKSMNDNGDQEIIHSIINHKFTKVTEDELLKVINWCPDKTCDMDAIPTSLLLFMHMNVSCNILSCDALFFVTSPKTRNVSLFIILVRSQNLISGSVHVCI